MPEDEYTAEWSTDDVIENLANAAERVATLLEEAVEDPTVEPYASALAALAQAQERATAY